MSPLPPQRLSLSTSQHCHRSIGRQYPGGLLGSTSPRTPRSPESGVSEGHQRHVEARSKTCGCSLLSPALGLLIRPTQSSWYRTATTGAAPRQWHRKGRTWVSVERQGPINDVLNTDPYVMFPFPYDKMRGLVFRIRQFVEKALSQDVCRQVSNQLIATIHPPVITSGPHQFYCLLPHTGSRATVVPAVRSM